MWNSALAKVDLAAIRDNLEVVRSLCPRSRVMAMVKANAYGHGLIPVARALWAADGLAVARLQEAMRLRKAGISSRILLLATYLDSTALSLCSKHEIDVTAHDQVSISNISEHARYNPLRVWLKLDTGMHRAGVSPAECERAVRLLLGHPGVEELVLMTHLSCADDLGSAMTEHQLSCYLRWRDAFPNVRASIANSAALISRPETHMDWVRPGLMLYGENPLGGQVNVPLRPAMTLNARIIAVRQLATGESVGYNMRWTSKRVSRIGLVGIGYGDGYPRHAPNGTPVWINGQLVPLVGQVSMDSLTVDLTDCDRVDVGDLATLWGENLSATVVAKYAGTIPYQLFTSLQTRVSREYVGDKSDVELHRRLSPNSALVN